MTAEVGHDPRLDGPPPYSAEQDLDEMFDLFFERQRLFSERIGKGVEELRAMSTPHERFELVPVGRIVRRAVDLFVGMVAAIVFLPFVLLIAIAIKTRSRGPLVYSIRHVRGDGREFTMRFFRTTWADFIPPDSPLSWSEDDARFTWIGRLLRATKLDGIPVVLNLLRGDMSLVGPRPLLREEFELTHASYRAAPGMTGPWRFGQYNRPIDEIVRNDCHYLAVRNFATDVAYFARTAPHAAARVVVGLGRILKRAR